MRIFLIAILFSTIQFVFAQEIILPVKRTFSSSLLTFNKIDTSLTSILDSTIKFRKVTFSTVIGEILLGGVGGIIGCIPPVAVMARMKAFEGIALLPLVYISYTFASSTAVYLLAEHYNPNTSFWGTIGAGFAGAALGVGTICLFMNNLSDGGFLLPLLGLPLLSEVLYVNLITSKTNYSTAQSSSLIAANKHYTTYQEIFNSSLIFHTEIFRLNF